MNLLRSATTIIALLVPSIIFAETAEFKQIKSRAKQGDINAMIDMARCYAYGWEDVKQNEKKAEKIFTEKLNCSHTSTNAVSPRALYHWGLFLFKSGRGSDHGHGVRCIYHAANDGDLWAQATWARGLMNENRLYSSMPLIYNSDYLCELTKFVGGTYFPIAREYYQKAAEQGDSQMQFEFAEQLCRNAHSTQGTYDDAEDNRTAAEQNHTEAQYRYGIHLYFGSLYNTPDTVAAVQWLEKAASAGHDEAIGELGFILINSKSQTDRDKGFKYLSMARNGAVHATRYYAYCIMNNKIPDEPNGEFLELLGNVSDHDGLAAILLGRCYDKGINCERSSKLAAQYYESGLDKNIYFQDKYRPLFIPLILEASKRLTYFYETGDGVYKNREKAKQYRDYTDDYENYLKQINYYSK